MAYLIILLYLIGTVIVLQSLNITFFILSYAVFRSDIFTILMTVARTMKIRESLLPLFLCLLNLNETFLDCCFLNTQILQGLKAGILYHEWLIILVESMISYACVRLFNFFISCKHKLTFWDEMDSP